jgi:phosphatidylglycerophosphate synthase
MPPVLAADRSLLDRSRKARPGQELVCDAIFRPLAQLLVLVLLPLRVPPPAVVLANAVAGIAAAIEIARGDLVQAALLLQLKTLLDNADGQLARASGRVSALGRYLDTEADLVVNAALFAALGYVVERPWLAAASFVCLTLVLSVDYNLDRLYRREHGELEAPVGRPPALLERIYGALLAPQDRAIEAVTESRLRRLGAGPRARLAYHDASTLRIVANFGLSTQLLVLGLCLALDAPAAYLWVPLGCAASLPVLAVRRELHARTVTST